MGLATGIVRALRRLEARMVLQSLRENLRYLGEQVDIDPSVEVLRPERVSIGTGSRIGKGARIVATAGDASSITIGESVRLRPYVHLLSYGGAISLGRRVTIGEGSVVCGHGGLEIGENTMISWLCSIVPANHIFERSDVPLRFQGEERLGIKIGSNVWIGSSVTVLDGVTIGDDAVIGAGAVVTRDIPAWAVALGAPARVVRDRREPRASRRLPRISRAGAESAVTDVDYYVDD